MTCGTVKNVSYSLTLYLAIAFMVLIAVGIILIAALVRRPRSDWREAVRNQTEDVRQSGMAGFQQNRVKPRTVSFEEIWEHDSVQGSAYIGVPHFPENVQEVKEQVIARWVIPEEPTVKTHTAPLPIVPNKDKDADSTPPQKGWGSMPTNSVIWITPSSPVTDEDTDTSEDDAQFDFTDVADDTQFDVAVDEDLDYEDSIAQVEPDTEMDSSEPAVDEVWALPTVPPPPPPPPAEWFDSEGLVEKPKSPRSIFKPLSMDDGLESGDTEGDLELEEIDTDVEIYVESDDLEADDDPGNVEADNADADFDFEYPDLGDEPASAETTDVPQANSVDVDAADIVHVPTSTGEESSTESLQPIAGFDFDEFEPVEADAATYEPFGAWLSKQKESSTLGLSLDWRDYMPRLDDTTAIEPGSVDEDDYPEEGELAEDTEYPDEGDESYESPSKN